MNRPRLYRAIARHELERWWHRTGVWLFVFLVPRSIRYWIIIKATNDYCRAHPHQEVPATTCLQAMEGVYPAERER